jgi:hypothetical protein
MNWIITRSVCGGSRFAKSPLLQDYIKWWAKPDEDWFGKQALVRSNFFHNLLHFELRNPKIGIPIPP